MKAIRWLQGLQQNQKGFSLAEILVVIAIMSIAVGMTGASIALMHSRDADQCAKKIDEALEEVRRSGMTMKGGFSLEIDLENKTYRILSTDRGDGDVQRLPGNVKLTMETQGGSVPVGTKKNVTVAFDKASGRVKQIQAEGTDVDGTLLTLSCTGGSKKVDVTLVRATGKHFLSYE